MHAKVQKWGNSLAVRIPQSFAKDTRLSAGAEVDLAVHDGKIVLDPRPTPRYSLSDLLKGVSKKNLHAEIDFGEPVGREVW